MKSRHTKRDFVFACLRVGGLFFAIDIKGVREVAKFKALEPSSRPAIDGFVKLRGLAVPVIDLRKRFLAPSGEGGKVVVTELSGRMAGLAVDEVCGVTAGSREMMIRPALSDEPWGFCVEAVLETGGSPVYVLDLGELLKERPLKVLSGDGETPQ